MSDMKISNTSFASPNYTPATASSNTATSSAGASGATSGAEGKDSVNLESGGYDRRLRQMLEEAQKVSDDLSLAQTVSSALDSASSMLGRLRDHVSGKVTLTDKEVETLTTGLNKIADQTYGGDNLFNAAAKNLYEGNTVSSAIKDVAGAGGTLSTDAIDRALNEVNHLQARNETTTRRLQEKSETIQVKQENYSAALSQVMDVTEAAFAVRDQILNQAGLAVVAQGAALPEGIWSLLK